MLLRCCTERASQRKGEASARTYDGSNRCCTRGRPRIRRQEGDASAFSRAGPTALFRDLTARTTDRFSRAGLRPCVRFARRWTGSSRASRMTPANSAPVGSVGAILCVMHRFGRYPASLIALAFTDCTKGPHEMRANAEAPMTDPAPAVPTSADAEFLEAAQRGDLEATKHALARGANVEARDSLRRTGLTL